jgi:uncharacterized OB-fold protein
MALTFEPLEEIPGGIHADEPYWNFLAAGDFRIPQCDSCGKWIWPAHWRCGVCGSWDSTWKQVEPKGTIYSWTRTWLAFERVRERAADIPYVVILAELAHVGGARVLGVLDGDSMAELRVGLPVRGIIAPRDPKTKGYPSILWRLDESATSGE